MKRTKNENDENNVTNEPRTVFADKDVDYELLDFGDGRRLERFGKKIFDRICPTVDSVRKKNPAIWQNVDFRFVPDLKLRQAAKNSKRGRWTPNTPEPFEVDFSMFRMELRGTPFGHLGIFPEQQTNWCRIIEQIQKTTNNRSESIKVLNLFAYTGGSSLAAAVTAPNVEVVHVDSAKSVVDWAKCNAELNAIGMSNEKGRIRFIVEDVRKFVQRELKRGNRYDAVILDPPSYGHGAKGESWKLSENLPDFLADLVALLSEQSVFFLLTAHTPGFGPEELRNILYDAGLPKNWRTEPISMDIAVAKTAGSTNRFLPSGCGVFSVR